MQKKIVKELNTKKKILGNLIPNIIEVKLTF